MARTYDKIFGAICNYNSAADSAVLKFCARHTTNTRALGLRTALACDVTAASSALWDAVRSKTPAEKLHHLTLALTIAADCASKHALQLQDHHVCDTESEAIADDFEKYAFKLLAVLRFVFPLILILSLSVGSLVYDCLFHLALWMLSLRC